MSIFQAKSLLLAWTINREKRPHKHQCFDLNNSEGDNDIDNEICFNMTSLAPIKTRQLIYKFHAQKNPHDEG